MKSIALACVLTFSAAVASNAAGTFRAFGKWQVACDNVGHCAAFGISGEDVGEPRGGLRITRDAGYEGKISVRMDGVDAAEKETVYIDGKPHMNESRQSGGRGASENDPSLALIARMLDGRAFALKEPSQPQDQIALAGLKAALLYIDDKQGRVGARNAFVARGDKMVARKAAPYPVVRAARTVDRAGKAPDMSDAAGKKVMAHYRRHADRKICDIGMEPGEAGDKPGEWYGLGRTLMLAEVSCWRAAYQAGSVFYLYDGPDRDRDDCRFRQWRALVPSQGARRWWLRRAEGLAVGRGGIPPDRPWPQTALRVFGCRVSAARRAGPAARRHISGDGFRIGRRRLLTGCGEPRRHFDFTCPVQGSRMIGREASPCRESDPVTVLSSRTEREIW